MRNRPLTRSQAQILIAFLNAKKCNKAHSRIQKVMSDSPPACGSAIFLLSFPKGIRVSPHPAQRRQQKKLHPDLLPFHSPRREGTRR